MSEYRVQLDVFTGPLDLLLYLIRRDEVDILDIPIARLTEQYVAHVRMIEHLDPDAVSDFLVMAATLVELKSRLLLPTPPIESLEDTDDPRAPLVKQLLEYKRFKDAARALERAADERAKKYVRIPAELPKELEGLHLEEVQVWDLLTAFGKVMSSIGRGPRQHEIRYDELPLEQHAAEIVARLERAGPTTFEALFEDSPERMHVIGRFLALLELIRARRVRAEQEASFGTIYVFLLVEVEAPESPEELREAAERDQVAAGPTPAEWTEPGAAAWTGPEPEESREQGVEAVSRAGDEAFAGQSVAFYGDRSGEGSGGGPADAERARTSSAEENVAAAPPAAVSKTAGEPATVEATGEDEHGQAQ